MKFVLALVLVAGVTVGACAPPPYPPKASLTAPIMEPPVVQVAPPQPKPIVLWPGRGLEIWLPINAGTGFDWRLDAEPPIEVLGEAERRVIPASLPGGPAQVIYRYRTLAPGRADLTFTLKRPWEPDQPDDRKETFHIEVRR